MALVDYLTTEEKEKVRKFKGKILDSYTSKEIKFYEKEIHFMLDLAEERYYTDLKRTVRVTSSDIEISKIEIPVKVIELAEGNEL